MFKMPSKPDSDAFSSVQMLENARQAQVVERLPTGLGDDETQTIVLESLSALASLYANLETFFPLLCRLGTHKQLYLLRATMEPYDLDPYLDDGEQMMSLLPRLQSILELEAAYAQDGQMLPVVTAATWERFHTEDRVRQIQHTENFLGRIPEGWDDFCRTFYYPFQRPEGMDPCRELSDDYAAHHLHTEYDIILPAALILEEAQVQT